MYASLIGAGASQIYDLYKSVTEKTGSTDTSFKTPTTDDTASSKSSRTGGTTGTSFSAAIQKLLVDLQAGTSASDSTSADATNTVASDLQSLFKTAKGGGPRGPGGPPPGPPPTSSTASTDDQSSTSSSTTSSSTTSSFQGLAASLMAYAKTQKLSASSSTSLTA